MRKCCTCSTSQFIKNNPQTRVCGRIYIQFAECYPIPTHLCISVTKDQHRVWSDYHLEYLPPLNSAVNSSSEVWRQLPHFHPLSERLLWNPLVLLWIPCLNASCGILFHPVLELLMKFPLEDLPRICLLNSSSESVIIHAFDLHFKIKFFHVVNKIFKPVDCWKN